MKEKSSNFIESIQAIIESKWFRDMIQRTAEESENTTSVSKLIGEVYVYAFATKSCNEKEIQSYLSKIGSKHKEEKDITRAKLILRDIAKQKGIPESEIETSKEIRDVFLSNYCEDGYVMHSFSEQNLETISSQGFLSMDEWKKREQEDKGDNLSIDEIAEIFERYGVIKACGTFPFYKDGGGLYVEQDPRKVYEHSTFAPEWFYEFSGSEHNSLSSKIDRHPLITRNYEACRTNIEDLCRNSGIIQGSNEWNVIISFFEQNWEKYGQGQKYAAIIPKDVIGKSDTSRIEELTEGMTNSNLVQCVLKDEYPDKNGKKTYLFQEHVGNKVEQAILPSDFTIIMLPDARELFSKQTDKDTNTTIDRQYSRETQEEIKPTEILLDYMVNKYAREHGLNMERVERMAKKVRTYWKMKDIVNEDRKIIEEIRDSITGMKEYQGLYMHPEHHIKNVAEFAYIIGKSEGKISKENLALLVQAAKYHDSGREHSEWIDDKHADASAGHAEYVLKEQGYTDEQISMVKVAIRYHEHNEKDKNIFDENFFEKISQEEHLNETDYEATKFMCIYLKDADALDRERFARNGKGGCDTRYLRTDTARSMMQYAIEKNADFSMEKTLIQAVEDLETKAKNEGNDTLLHKIDEIKNDSNNLGNIFKIAKMIQEHLKEQAKESEKRSKSTQELGKETLEEQTDTNSKMEVERMMEQQEKQLSTQKGNSARGE